MPLPLLIPIGIGAVALAGTTAGVVKKFKKHVQVENLAILGDEGVGKTELLTTFAANDISEKKTRLSKPSVGYSFTLHTPGPSTRAFRVSKDLSGYAGPGQKRWRRSFEFADHVLYVFRSDLIIAGDQSVVNRVKSDLEYLADWSSDLLAAKKAPPRILLIGLFADKRDEGLGEKEFVGLVRASDALRLQAVKLGNADMIVGDLGSQESAQELVRRIADCFQD